jgi:hypothetical protein
MTNYNPFRTTAALDEVLLDVATLLELSPRDRSIAENRYRRLKVHLERKNSPLAPYLIDGQSMIYAQGSIATSTTIISGTDDDRFDVDAIVEFDVPGHWSDSHALDLLEEALQGFPGATKIVRCTRCVQIQFPFMHMDVTVLDRSERILTLRAGDIFHSPDEGIAYRVPSNPWGFTSWFRSSVGAHQEEFAELVRRHRASAVRNRLQPLDEGERLFVAKADQQDLPPMIPSRMDAQEVIALKLLKRYVNLHYENSPLRQPPSIYLAKRTGDLGYVPLGLSAQLVELASSIARVLRNHLASGTRPDETNPSYRPDRINDRWPSAGALGLRDMREFADALEHLVERLNAAAAASLAEISKVIDELFGERIGQEQRRVLSERYDRRDKPTTILTEPRTGSMVAPAIVKSPSAYREVRPHNFHPFILDSEDEQ